MGSSQYRWSNGCHNCRALSAATSGDGASDTKTAWKAGKVGLVQTRDSNANSEVISALVASDRREPWLHPMPEMISALDASDQVEAVDYTRCLK